MKMFVCAAISSILLASAVRAQNAPELVNIRVIKNGKTTALMQLPADSKIELWAYKTSFKGLNEYHADPKSKRAIKIVLFNNVIVESHHGNQVTRVTVDTGTVWIEHAQFAGNIEIHGRKAER